MNAYVYCSPTFCRRSKLDNELVIEKPDEFGWLNAFDPRRGACVRNNSSSSLSSSLSESTPKTKLELRRIAANRQRSDPLTKRKSMAAKEAPSEQTATENLLAKKQKQRPFSLVVDNNASLGLPQVAANVNHRSCCNLRNDAAEPSGEATINRSLLTSGMKDMENLSRSCGDLRTNPADAHRLTILPELRRTSATSQISLCSGQFSTPTDSRTGSRVSLISEGVDSYEGLYEKAYKATYVLNTPDPPSVSEEKVPRDRMVRDWLDKNTPEDPKPSKTSDVAAL
ncbi:uncharacterized protein [Amphiura filiformis]|uniref:uncharacterized protein n=1 Tax=Amphiura filiformis TaxID=82378 RepID=UPI003B2111D1